MKKRIVLILVLVVSVTFLFAVCVLTGNHSNDIANNNEEPNPDFDDKENRVTEIKNELIIEVEPEELAWSDIPEFITIKVTNTSEDTEYRGGQGYSIDYFNLIKQVPASHAKSMKRGLVCVSRGLYPLLTSCEATLVALAAMRCKLIRQAAEQVAKRIPPIRLIGSDWTKAVIPPVADEMLVIEPLDTISFDFILLQPNQYQYAKGKYRVNFSEGYYGEFTIK